MRTAFIEELTSLARQDPAVMLLTGDLGYTVFEQFQAEFPTRYINCGVAEANMMGTAAGLAREGVKPFVYSFIPFAIFRCLEQIRIDICYHELPVTIVGLGAGYSYGDMGATHHAVEDIAMARSLPGLCVVCPGDPWEVRHAVRALAVHPGPAYIRLGKRGEPIVHGADTHHEFHLGRALVIQEGRDVALLATSNILPTVVEAARRLEVGASHSPHRGQHAHDQAARRELPATAERALPGDLHRRGALCVGRPRRRGLRGRGRHTDTLHGPPHRDSGSLRPCLRFTRVLSATVRPDARRHRRTSRASEGVCMRQKVFITGGAGFIGSLLAVKFLRNGWDVVAYDALRSFVLPHERLDYPRHVQFRLRRIREEEERNGQAKFELVEGNICNPELLARSMRDASPDVVIHLAAISIADASQRHLEDALAINQTGTTNVLNAARDCQVKRFVYASSSMAYGDFVHFPAAEDHPTIPLEVYGASKLCGEIYVRTYHEMFGLDFVIVRPCSVYGPTDTNQRIVQRFIDCAMRGREIQLFDGGTQVLDFTWVEDTAEGFYLAATHPAAINETFNITSGTARTLRDLADIARCHFPDLKVIPRESRDPVRRTRRGALDVGKARRMLGYEPRTMLDAGFARYVAFCREHELAAVC